jgi:gluconokinase
MHSIGIDIGTTSTKGILFDEEGKEICKDAVEYGIISLRPDQREQDPEEIMQAVTSVLRTLSSHARMIRASVSFVSFSAAMHSLIVVDEEGRPLTGSIIWSDSRASEFVKRYRISGKGARLTRRTGTPCHPMSPFYKILWMKERDRETFTRTSRFISIKEYVFFRLFGKYIVDHSIASATGLFNITTLEWDDLALEEAGITKDLLSEPVETTRTISGLLDEAVKTTGLSRDTVFVIGASDGCLANLGSHGNSPGTAVVSIGTSGALRVLSDKPVLDPEGRTFCYVLTEGAYVAGGAINNGGMAYKWYRDVFCQKVEENAGTPGLSAYDRLNRELETTSPGSFGLLFLPFLTGERAPYWNEDLRGSFIGISDLHERKHFQRAVFEGVCYSLRDVLEVLKGEGIVIRKIYANGGFSRSTLWVRILADVLGVPVTLSKNYETPCVGAMILGHLATGGISTLEEGEKYLESGETYLVSEDSSIYQRMFDMYREAVGSLKGIMERLAGIQKETGLK